MVTDESEKEGRNNMSGLRQSYERMKETQAYADLPMEAKEELEKAITQFEFAIQTEYEPCKEFVLEAMHQGEIDDIESVVNDEDMGPLLRESNEGVATIYRAIISNLMQSIVQWAAHMEEVHMIDKSMMDGLYELISQISKACLVTDYVVGETVALSMDAQDMKFGIAHRDHIGDFLHNGGLIEDEEDEDE